MGLEFHLWASLFPLADGTRLAALGQDIRKDGQMEPIVLYEGKILDGRNRYRACVLIGATPKLINFEELDTDEDPLTYMVRRNVRERYLGKGQLAAIGVDILNMFDHQPYSTERIKEVADLVGAGWSSVERLVAIQKRDPSLLNAVRAGFTSVSTASRDAGFREYDAPIPGVNDYFGKGDKFRESTEPLARYLASWRSRDFEFRHVNPKEADQRVRKIDELISGLQEARDDLAKRSVKSKLTH